MYFAFNVQVAAVLLTAVAQKSAADSVLATAVADAVFVVAVAPGLVDVPVVVLAVEQLLAVLPFSPVSL